MALVALWFASLKSLDLQNRPTLLQTPRHYLFIYLSIFNTSLFLNWRVAEICRSLSQLSQGKLLIYLIILVIIFNFTVLDFATLSEPNFLRCSCQTDWGLWPECPGLMAPSICQFVWPPSPPGLPCVAVQPDITDEWTDRDALPLCREPTLTWDLLINLWLLISWWSLGLIRTARFFCIFFCFKYSLHKACSFSGVFGRALTFDLLLLKPSRFYRPRFFFPPLSVICRISYVSGSFTTLQHYQMAPSHETANQETQTLLPLIDLLTRLYRFHSASLIKIGQNLPLPFPPLFQQKVPVLLRNISCMWKSSEPGDKTGNFTVSTGHLKGELWGLTFIQKMVLSAHPVLCFWWQNICQMH